MPTASDLVTDLPADFEVFGQAVDTSLADLKGGTTGQVLSKASNTDMDFTWVAQDDSNAIQNALLTTTGDTIYASATSTPARLGIGTSGQVLTVSGGVPSWATPTGAADNFQLINAGGTALTGATTVTVSGISGKNRLFVNIANASSVNASPTIGIRLNTDSGANYSVVAFYNTAGSTTGSLQANGGTSLDMGDLGNNATNYLSAWIQIDGTNAAGYKPINFSSNTSGGVTNQSRTGNAVYMGTSSISSISVISSSGNLDAGTIYVYGA